jgi:hypothetical protein
MYTPVALPSWILFRHPRERQMRSRKLVGSETLAV